VTTEVKTFFPKNSAAVWGRLVGGIEIDVIPGDHLSIVNKDFVPLGAVLTRYMQELDSGSYKGETKEKRSQPLSL